MHLGLDQWDLILTSRDKSAWELKYKDFKPRVQQAIDAVGRGLYRDKETHQLIYNPSQEPT